MEPTNTSSTPDAWDQEEDIKGAGDPAVTDAAHAFTALNVNAAAFVPGQNVFASAFVMPSFGAPPTTTTTTINGEADSPTDENKDLKSEENSKSEEQPPDDWEAGGSNTDSGGGTRSGSPGSDELDEDEDEDEDEEEDSGASTPDGEARPPKPRKKHKSISRDPAVKKDHLNIVFIGHVDAGKSTICGHLMYLTGMVDKRTLEKYEKEAKEKNRESWYLSWALDTNQEERDKGKTVEVGRAYFETDTKHFTILDAPGHRSYVPNMIGGASQADLAVLVISARRGEFETGFERGGQTREHAMLVKTAGVKHLVVLINKMDDPTVLWEKERYDEIIDKITPYLKKVGFNPKTDLKFIPCSGLTGAFLKDDTAIAECSWYDGLPLIPHLDGIGTVSRNSEGPIRIPIVDRYKDMGTIVLGKVESGLIRRGGLVTMMPNNKIVEIMQLWSDEDEVEYANPGENVKMKLKNCEEDDVSPGFVLCSSEELCMTGQVFDAQVVILEYKSIICAGFQCVMHIHTSAEEVSIKNLICLIDKKTGEKSKTRPRFIKQDQIAIVRFQVMGGIICMEPFKLFPQMGRFTLRDENRSIAIGKVLKIIA